MRGWSTRWSRSSTWIVVDRLLAQPDDLNAPLAIFEALDPRTLPKKIEHEPPGDLEKGDAED
jgi:hypothetical protein